MIVGDRVRERMDALELTQAELARRVGLAQPSIYGLIHSNKVGSKHLHKIARELNTTPAYLSGETDDPASDAPEPEYSSDERALIACYRDLPTASRAALMQVARSMAANARGPDDRSPVEQ
jgi:transcriptional regulator with XRE-family HTH domain